MRGMFYKATAFNQPLTFNTKQVMTMGDMFQGATAFNQPLTFDTKQVTDMHSMFSGAIAFDQDISGWDTSEVTDMADMFLGATEYNKPMCIGDDHPFGCRPQVCIDVNVPYVGCIMPACPAGQLRVSDGAGCTIPVELTTPACPTSLENCNASGLEVIKGLYNDHPNKTC